MNIQRRKGSPQYTEYWNAVGRARSVHQLRMTAYFVLVLETLFIGLDWWAYPNQFVWFAPMRLGMDLFALAVLIKLRFWRPKFCEYAITLLVGAHVLAMVYATGAAMSLYYPGLIIVFVGMPVLQPLTAKDSLVICTLLMAGFLASPAFTSVAIDWTRFGISGVFVLSGAFESVMSCMILTDVRLREFRQRREVERARDDLAQLDEAKSRFTANVHHELRTPLTLMLAPLEAMISGDFGDLGTQQARYLRTMHVNGLRLLKLINNLLDLARIESNQLELRRRSSAVGRIASDVVAGAEGLAEQKQVRLVADGLESLPRINADVDAVEKVVVNLVGNALKFTDPGGSVEVRGSAMERGGVHLVVADSGIGLAADQLQRIFDRFAQADMSATRRHEGSGIGLALAKELVEAHGGQIWAESEGPGRGAQFHVVLPAGEADMEEGLLEGDSEPPSRSSREESVWKSVDGIRVEPDGPRHGAADRLVEMEYSVERWRQRQGQGQSATLEVAGGISESAAEVLVVEDNADMRQLLAFVVGQEFRVRTAANGHEAMEAVRTAHPDLVLTDVMMPEVSGTELCKSLKSDPATAGIPVVLVTSKADREMKIEGLEDGADDYVTKPFHPRELLARVRSLARLRRLQQDLEIRNDSLKYMNAELERAMSELKEAELQVLQSERLAAVGELAAGVAHEVNNPVNFAVNALHTLQIHVESLAEIAQRIGMLDLHDSRKLEGQLAELEALQAQGEMREVAMELRQLVGIVTEGLDRTRRLVGELRDFAGNGRGRRTAVNLRRGLESTLQLLRRHFRDAGICVEVQLGSEPLVVDGDPGALNQIFLNLLKNSADALEARSDGRIWITGSRDNGWVSVTIRDNGPGIPEERRTRLFEPFFSTKEAGRGSGLGLAICRRITTEHGGTLVLTSPPGEGATFTLRLPEDQARPGDTN